MGSHKITVKNTGNNGVVTTQNLTVYKVPENSSVKPQLLCIDTPNNSIVLINDESKQLAVRGWSLNGYGVQKVQVYFDGANEKDAEIAQSRQDVNKVFTGYSNEENSGYNCNLNISSLVPGMHTIKVVSIGKYGIKITSTTQIYRLGKDHNSLPQSRICIDTPQNNVGIKAQNYLVSVGGWSLNAFGVKKVQIYVDNKVYSDAQIGISRADVNNVYPGYTGGAQSGYKSVINISSLSYGEHTISVRSTGNDDSITSEDIVIYKVPNNTNVAPKLVSFLSTGNNVQKTEIEAVRLHDGDQHNNCVYFSSTALRAVGVNVPLSMANTKNYIPYLSSLGWQKYYNANLLYPGNILFTVPDGSGYSTHTYVFMGWVDQNDHTKAYVADNQDDFIHVRSLIDAPGVDAFNFAFYN
jgi:hypothetical protein